MKKMLPPLEIRLCRTLPSSGRLASLLMLTVGMLLAGRALAQEKLVAQYPWKTLPAHVRSDASLLGKDETRGEVCAIDNPASQPMRKTILTIESPAITEDFYRLAGEIRYEGVEGDSYLEMWSTFPPAKPGGGERSYFSRTLAENNQMGKLRGTSDWREFSLPFNAKGSDAHPVRLTFNVVLVGKGKVMVSGAKLWQGPAGASGWWQRTSMESYAGNAAPWILAFIGFCGAGGVVMTAMRLRRRYRRNEARRMAARDILA